MNDLAGRAENSRLYFSVFTVYLFTGLYPILFSGYGERGDGPVKGGFRRLMDMFECGDPLADHIFMVSMVSLAVLAAVVILLVLVHIRRRKRSESLAKEIMEDCRTGSRRTGSL